MKLTTFLLSLVCLGTMSFTGPVDTKCKVTASSSDLQFNELSKTWDEGIPLGNATIGALVWKHGNNLRFSLDRTDLWDLRPVDSLSGPTFKYEWVKRNLRNKDCKPIQKKLDWPYDNIPAPTKIPGAALEFSLEKIGTPTSVHLYLNNALCEVNWKNGVELQTFVHSTKDVGWFVFRNLRADITPSLIVPAYSTDNHSANTGLSGESLTLKSLGYEQGTVSHGNNEIVYHQKGYDGFYYDVAVKWVRKGTMLYGTWSISSSMSNEKAIEEVNKGLQRGLAADYRSHLAFWNKFWAQSSVSIPEPLLQKQYQNEMYKFGSTAHENSYPISLQAVWTADNGNLPPWKGDFHNDLNTQLSYWPSYVGNHLTEEMGYLNTLWNQRDVYKKYTRQYFEVDGMTVPGVCTLTGEPMGGWSQYSLSPTVGAWLSQHFYWHWKYSKDDRFLKERGYPFVKDVATFLENITQVDANGTRTLEFSTSPEIYENSMKAWFSSITNYDLSMMHFLFKAASEMATTLGLSQEASHWTAVEKQLPALNLDSDGALTFAKGFPYNVSHRHFSHAMSIYPLELINWSDGKKSQDIIRATIKKLKDYGPDWWCGYSYSWFAIMNARAMDGEEAANNLRIFANCFCLKNTFHANGDQTRSGKSKFDYRPFTLEGNMAFAAGVQEMLLQSNTGVIRIFPAIPAEWKNVSFNNLRAMGAFLVSATKKEGKVTRLTIRSEKGGTVKVVSPKDDSVLTYNTRPGEVIRVIASK